MLLENRSTAISRSSAVRKSHIRGGTGSAAPAGAPPPSHADKKKPTKRPNPQGHFAGFLNRAGREFSPARSVLLGDSLGPLLVLLICPAAHSAADLLEQGDQVGVEKILLEKQFAAFSFCCLLTDLHSNKFGLVLLVRRGTSASHSNFWYSTSSMNTASPQNKLVSQSGYNNCSVL